MGTRTWLRQDAQIAPSVTYNGALAAGSALQSSATDIEYDLNAIRSQVKRVLDYTTGNWYDDVPTINTKKRSIYQLGDHLDQLEEHKFLFRVQILTDVAVPTGQNWVVLNVTGSEAPTETAAVDLGTANGVIVAALPGDVGAHSLLEVSGYNAVSPKNLILVHDVATGDVVTDAGKEVYGLLQVENGVVDGNNFNDTNKQIQISFVKENAGGTDLVAVSVAAIENKTIHYAYVLRINLDAVPEYAFLAGVFADQSASVDVTLNNAIDNQAGPATQQQNIEWRIDDTKTLKFQTSDGGVDMLALIPTVGGDTLQVNVDTLDINNVNSADFLNGAIFDSGGTSINVGVSAGQIDAAGLKVASTGANDLKLASGKDLWLTDSYRAGSTWSLADGIKLAASSSEWSAFETAYGEVSLLNAITQAAGGASAHNKKYAVCLANIPANTNVTGAVGSPNIDNQLFDYVALDFMTDVSVFLNGQLLRPGADAAANNDYYPGTTPANGDLMFEFSLHGTGSKPDVLTMEVF